MSGKEIETFGEWFYQLSGKSKPCTCEVGGVLSPIFRGGLMKETTECNPDALPKQNIRKFDKHFGETTDHFNATLTEVDGHTSLIVTFSGRNGHSSLIVTPFGGDGHSSSIVTSGCL